MKLTTLLLCALSCVPSFAQTNTARMLSGINAQTGISYVFQPSDATKLTTFANAQSMTATLPNPALTQGFGAGTILSIQNQGPGSLTILCTNCVITTATTSSSSFTMQAGTSADLYSSGAGFTANSSAGNVGASTGTAVPVYAAPGTTLTPDPFIGDSSGLGDWFAGTFTGTGVGGVIRFPCQTQPTTFRGSSLTAGNAYVYCDSGSNLLGCIFSNAASCTGTGASGAAGGDLSGSYPNPRVSGLTFNATHLPDCSTAPTSGQFLKYDGTCIGGSSGASATSTPICALTSTTDTITTATSFATTCPVTTASISGVGQVIHIVAHGVWSTTGTASPVVKFRVNAGGTTGICTNTATSDALNTTQTNAVWDVNCDILIATTGAPGTAIAWGKQAIATSSGAPIAVSPRFYVNAGTVSYITNSSQTVSIEETATPVTGQSFTLQSLLVWNY